MRRLARARRPHTVVARTGLAPPQQEGRNVPLQVKSVTTAITAGVLAPASVPIRFARVVGVTRRPVLVVGLSGSSGAEASYDETGVVKPPEEARP
jgi:hypothetical protein